MTLDAIKYKTGKLYAKVNGKKSQIAKRFVNADTFGLKTEIK
jgi:hypothetical protein